MNDSVKNYGRVALIRADGSKKIGMGHLMRSSLVSDMLLKQFGMESLLIMKEDSDALKFMTARGVDIAVFPSTITYDEEIVALQNMVDDKCPLLFFLDVLENDTSDHYTTAIKESGCPLVAITDDSHRRIINADLVLSGNPNQLGQDYSNEKGEYLKGPMFFLMDPAYGEAEVSFPPSEVNNILLTLGGSDHNNLIFRVLEALKKIGRRLKVRIVTTRSTGYQERLKRYLQGFPLPYQLIFDAKSLVPLWSKCDMAITAGGNTLFERIAIRLSGVTLCQLERQMEIADSFQSMGVNVNLGFGPAISDDAICRGILNLINNKVARQSQYQRAPEVIDGKGIHRLGDRIESLLEVRRDELRKSCSIT